MKFNAFSNNLTRSYALALGLMTLLTLIVLIGLYQSITTQETLKRLMQASERQRALTQSVALSATQWSQSQTESERQLWRQRLQAHVNQLEQTTQQSATPQALLTYINTAKSLLGATNGILPPEQPELSDLTASAALSVSLTLDAAIQQYESADQKNLEQLRLFGVSGLGAILFGIAGATLFIFRPLMRRINHHTRQLIESQRTLDMVLDTVGEAIITVDRHSHIVRVNQEVSDIWGYTSAELLGAPINMLFSPQYRDQHRDASDARSLGHRIEIEGLRKNGMLFPMEMRFKRTVVGNELLFTGAFQDVSRHKDAEAKIQRQLETIKALYANAQKLSESLDPISIAQDITRTCVEIFGARMAWLGRAENDGLVRLIEQCPASAKLPQQLRVYWDKAPESDPPEPIGRAIQSGEAVMDSARVEYADSTPWRKLMFAHGFRCMASFPLISRDRPFGALNLYHEQPDFFNRERIEFFQSYAHQAAAALENARLFAEDRRRLERTQALRAIDTAIRGSLDLSVTLSILLDQVLTNLKVDAAVVLLLNAETQTLDHAANRGFLYHGISRTHLRLGKGHAGEAALTRKLVCVSSLQSQPDDPTRMSLLAGERFVAYYAMPLIAKGQVKGVLEIFHRDDLSPDFEWFEFLESLASQAAIALDNATLLLELQRSNDELKVAYDGTLEGWSRALDLRDSDTEGHTMRVTNMAVQLAHTLGLSQEAIVQIHRGSLLHDIGKMGIPDSILRKPGKLTDEEWEIMRRHPQYAYDMLYPIKFLRSSLDIPYAHHEKWDGTGYPRGLKAEQIPLSARIFSVVDVWDALSSDRPYHKGWPSEKVQTHIQELAGKHFDPQITDVFLRLLRGD